ncbi:MAG: Gfo/Idh/MocA family oxidoreductase [Candidatus Bathyarchaeota archaeon]|nr:MAG: Gfo/Idh/MocA family oxidoreductase [Candidatus Bathyarchaeota archaeon]
MWRFRFTKPRIVLVGAGRFGRNHLRVLKEIESEGLCTLHGIVDTRSEVLEEVGRDHNIKTSSNIDDFLGDDVDGMDIVTPTGTHFKLCLKCLEAGKHVFVEKPLTTSHVQAEQLVQMAEERHRILMVGHIFRYNSAIRRIREIIEKGELGEIYYLFGRFMGIKNPRVDVGALFNYTVHHIDIYNYLLDKPPEEVNCSTGYFLQRENLEDVCVLVLRYPPNTMGIVEGSWLPPGKHRDLTIVGSRKSITSDLLSQTLEVHKTYIKDKDGRLEAINEGSTRIDVQFEEPLKLELMDFIQCIGNGKEPLASGRTAINVIKTVEKALESARLGRKVRIFGN